MADKYKSKFGHIRHILCEVDHTALCGYLIVIVAILADISQKVKSTRRKSETFLCDLKHISYPQVIHRRDVGCDAYHMRHAVLGLDFWQGM
jgi:hypothetical protein